MIPGSIGTLPVGVRPGTGEARQASLEFRAGAEGTPARAAPTSEFGFDDFIDLINPLQHLPIVGTLYRAWTGDAIEGPARILGDALYGGPIGLAFGILDAIVEQASGADVGGHVYANLFGADEAGTPPVEAADVALADEPPAIPPVPVEVEPTVPPGQPAITGYQEALDAMAVALDRYHAAETPMGHQVDASY